MATRRGDLRVLRGTMIHGPMTRDQLAGLVAAGRVAGTDLVSMAEGPWGPVAAHLGDHPRFEADGHAAEGVTDNDRAAPSRWHYSRGGSKLGPVSSGRLKELAASGELMPSDLVWKEGLPDWRPASTVRGLFPGIGVKLAGPPQLPRGETAPPAAGLDAAPVVTQPGDPGEPPARPEPDFFDRARGLTQKAKAKADAFQKEARANPNYARVAIERGAKAAADYARSDDARELARKARDTLKGGAMAATALAGAASAGGRGRAKKVAEHPLGVGASLLCFFPLGLYLVWHHPRWTQARKLAWTGAWLGVFSLMMVPAILVQDTVPNGWPPNAPAPYGTSGGRAEPAPAPQLDGPTPSRLQGDDGLIQGVWNVLMDDGSEKAGYVFLGDQLYDHLLGAEEPYKCRFTLDPSKNPKHITWEADHPKGHFTVRGLYEFKDDLLVICSNKIESARVIGGGPVLGKLASQIPNTRPEAIKPYPDDLFMQTTVLKRPGPSAAADRLRRVMADRGGPSRMSVITADELRSRIVGEDFRPRKKFFDLYGEPDRVVDLGDKTYLHYTCKDGRVVIECPKGPYQYDDDLAPLSVDRR